ncbi:LysR family transcriptional regulator [Roseomonas sp. M0104]|uniref:LysR family transcriptional regulator n=1 Tax=Teichococcus coralli TaxID=2545983 RepID=A0A845BGH0_9PROT|nr:LysR family transcriptional regulator [Pseudoroseomonas coralli]MXP65206.1 LysR family transcriptional regulator [Pseudoroseomonas coralli]
MDRLTALRLFLRTLDRGGIAAAGRSLGLSATAASRALRELEEELAIRLFNRTTRHVAPTEAGRRFAAHIAPLLESLDAAMTEAREMHEEATGTLRIVARRSYALRHVVPHLASFRATHPRVEIDLALTEQTGLVPAHGVDLVIRLGLPSGKSFVGHRLASGRRILCASPDYIARHGAPATPDAVLRHPCLTYREADEAPVWVFTLASGNQQELAVSGPLRSNSGEALRLAALDDMGLVLLPEWMIGEDVAAGRLTPLLSSLPAWPGRYQAEIHAVHARTDRLPAKIVAFVAHLLAAEDPAV